VPHWPDAYFENALERVLTWLLEHENLIPIRCLIKTGLQLEFGEALLGMLSICFKSVG
jgi:hypothetical protein